MAVNDRPLEASAWAIKKIYNYLYDILEERYEKENLNNIQADLTDPNFAQSVFDVLDDEQAVNEGKKKKESPIHTKKWERCVKDVKKQNKKDGKDYDPYAVCTASIGYKGSVKKPHRKKKEEEIEEATTHASVWGANGPPVVPIFGAKGKDHVPSRKPIFKGGKIVQKINNSGVLTENSHVVPNYSPRLGVTLTQFIDDLIDKQLTDVEFVKVGENHKGKKTMIFSTTTPLGNDILTKTWWDNPDVRIIESGNDTRWIIFDVEDGVLTKDETEYDLFQEVNKIKWVKGGKYVKIKDKCAKYNNQPWCSQGAIDNPLEFSDTVFENIEEVSKVTGLSEEKILDRIKAKLRGVTPEQMDYNKEHGLPIWWKGSKEGFYEKMEPRKNYTGSN